METDINLEGDLGGEQVHVHGNRKNNMWTLQSFPKHDGPGKTEFIAVGIALVIIAWMCVMRCSGCKFKG